MTATEKLDLINNALAAGKTVMISTMTRATKVTPKNAKKWAANGWTMFKLDGNSLLMAAGRRFDCIDYCRISTHG